MNKVHILENADLLRIFAAGILLGSAVTILFLTS